MSMKTVSYPHAPSGCQTGPKSNGLFAYRPSLPSGRARTGLKVLMLGIVSREVNPSNLLSPMFCFCSQPDPLHQFSDSPRAHWSPPAAGFWDTRHSCLMLILLEGGACGFWPTHQLVGLVRFVSCHWLHGGFVVSVYFVSGFPLFPLVSQLTGSPIR